MSVQYAIGLLFMVTRMIFTGWRNLLSFSFGTLRLQLNSFQFSYRLFFPHFLIPKSIQTNSLCERLTLSNLWFLLTAPSSLRGQGRPQCLARLTRTALSSRAFCLVTFAVVPVVKVFSSRPSDLTFDREKEASTVGIPLIVMSGRTLHFSELWERDTV